MPGADHYLVAGLADTSADAAAAEQWASQWASVCAALQAFVAEDDGRLTPLCCGWFGSGLLSAPHLGSPASSDGPAAFYWVALRAREESPSRSDRHEGPWCHRQRVPKREVLHCMFNTQVLRLGGGGRDTVRARAAAHLRAAYARLARRRGRARQRPRAGARAPTMVRLERQSAVR